MAVQLFKSVDESKAVLGSVPTLTQLGVMNVRISYQVKMNILVLLYFSFPHIAVQVMTLDHFTEPRPEAFVLDLPVWDITLVSCQGEGYEIDPEPDQLLSEGVRE